MGLWVVLSTPQLPSSPEPGRLFSDFYLLLSLLH